MFLICHLISQDHTDIHIFVFFSSPLFFSLSAIALEVDSREILKFMMSSFV